MSVGTIVHGGSAYHGGSAVPNGENIRIRHLNATEIIGWVLILSESAENTQMRVIVLLIAGIRTLA